MLRASNDKYHVYVSIVHTQSLNLHFNGIRILMLHNINDIPNIKHHSVCTYTVLNVSTVVNMSVDGKLRGKQGIKAQHEKAPAFERQNGKILYFSSFYVLVRICVDGELY